MAMDWPSEISGWFKSWQVRVTPERSRVCDPAQCNPLTTSPMGLTLWVRCAWFCGSGVTLIPCRNFRQVAVNGGLGRTLTELRAAHRRTKAKWPGESVRSYPAAAQLVNLCHLLGHFSQKSGQVASCQSHNTLQK